jgi:N-hydroxyarylamine O-acetyltransferase
MARRQTGDVTIDVDAYLARIGYDGARTPTLDVLQALQLAHVRTVPFENLDVFAGAGVRVDRAWSIPKVVERRRGGWCFELNGAFSALLESLGFAVTLQSGQVDQGGGLGPELDHLVLVVDLDGRRWLVDVGFGDSALAPLDLAVDEPQDGVSGRYRIAALEDGVVEMSEEQPDGSWTRQLRVDPTPRRLDEFEPRSNLLQTEPGLMWTTKRFATRASDAGGAARVWLFSDRVKFRKPDSSTTETAVEPGDWDAALWVHFGMRLG